MTQPDVRSCWKCTPAAAAAGLVTHVAGLPPSLQSEAVIIHVAVVHEQQNRQQPGRMAQRKACPLLLALHMHSPFKDLISTTTQVDMTTEPAPYFPARECS